MNNQHVKTFRSSNLFFLLALSFSLSHMPGLAQGSSSYLSDMNARFSSFEINKIDAGSTITNTTPLTTRHHRFGAETGIGSSTFQTQSATVESMPKRVYEPAASSSSTTSAAQPSFKSPALADIHLSGFGNYTYGNSSSPAFSSPVLTPSSFDVQTRGFSTLSSPFPSTDVRFSRRQRPGFGNDLIDPLSGL